MSREIKFRAWDKDYKRMLYKDFYDLNWYETPRNDDGGCHTFKVMSYTDRSHIELMQYTGLKDKNGKEIYEGDIVRHKLYRLPYQVKYSLENTGYDLWMEAHSMHLCNLCQFNLEVIGNIYENPKLLK